MLATVPTRMMRILVGSAVRQLAVLGAACVPLAAVVALLEAMLLPPISVALVGWVVLVAAFVASVDVARGRTMTLERVVRRLPHLLPRALAQSSITAAPILVVVGLFVVMGGIQPLLALALVPIALVVATFALTATMLALVAVVHGDAEWVPLVALGMLRRRPWRLAGLVVAAAVPIAFAALPAMLVGAIAQILLGPLGALGTGLMVASFVPFGAVLGLATWRVLGGRMLTRCDDAPIAATPAAQHTATAAPSWQPGPFWQVELDPVQPWGTWIELPAAAVGAAHTVGIMVEAVGVTMPRLLTCDTAGAWLEWPVPATGGTVLPITLPAGASYLQLQSTASVACHARLTIATLVQGHVTDAAA